MTIYKNVLHILALDHRSRLRFTSIHHHLAIMSRNGEDAYGRINDARLSGSYFPQSGPRAAPTRTLTDAEAGRFVQDENEQTSDDPSHFVPTFMHAQDELKRNEDNESRLGRNHHEEAESGYRESGHGEEHKDEPQRRRASRRFSDLVIPLKAPFRPVAHLADSVADVGLAGVHAFTHVVLKRNKRKSQIINNTQGMATQTPIATLTNGQRTDINTRRKFLLKLAKALMSYGAPSHRISSMLVAASDILGAKAGLLSLTLPVYG